MNFERQLRSAQGNSLAGQGRSRVPGWDFLLKLGVQELAVRAPAEPGEYQVVCTVICSQDYEGTHMKFVVPPSGEATRATTADSDPSEVAGEIRTFTGEDRRHAMCYQRLLTQSLSRRDDQGQEDAASCASYCVCNMSYSVVLLHDNKTIYRLDDQVRAAAYAGQKVHVQGMLEQDSNTIQVSSIGSAD